MKKNLLSQENLKSFDELISTLEWVITQNYSPNELAVGVETTLKYLQSIITLNINHIVDTTLKGKEFDTYYDVWTLWLLYWNETTWDCWDKKFINDLIALQGKGSALLKFETVYHTHRLMHYGTAKDWWWDTFIKLVLKIDGMAAGILINRFIKKRGLQCDKDIFNYGKFEVGRELGLPFKQQDLQVEIIPSGKRTLEIDDRIWKYFEKRAVGTIKPLGPNKNKKEKYRLEKYPGKLGKKIENNYKRQKNYYESDTQFDKRFDLTQESMSYVFSAINTFEDREALKSLFHGKLRTHVNKNAYNLLKNWYKAQKTEKRIINKLAISEDFIERESPDGKIIQVENNLLPAFIDDKGHTAQKFDLFSNSAESSVMWEAFKDSMLKSIPETPPSQRKVLKQYFEDPWTTQEKVAKKVGISARQVRNILSKLKENEELYSKLINYLR